ncbi:L,D-transpeptidase [Synechococcus sp. PCC 7335]|uniref:L,D-transpeptidase n=1 Tax=Synechococcus sp. (strain ATCC 29403 / PCC 7335) TaxID=91464 RepID=UPI00056F95EE|nr:L,D-transpeptidase [Synechococcus sp. PCC 7335]
MDTNAMSTKRIKISLGSNAKGTLECVGFEEFSCLGKKDAPYKTDVTVKGEVGVDKFSTRRSSEFQVDLNWVIVMDGNKGYWIHEGDVGRRSSAGCINLIAEDAKKVYGWVDGRTRITITAPWL